jgi:hypothetical protein
MEVLILASKDAGADAAAKGFDKDAVTVIIIEDEDETVVAVGCNSLRVLLVWI